MYKLKVKKLCMELSKKNKKKKTENQLNLNKYYTFFTVV